MAKHGGSKSGTIVKRGAGGRFMGSIKMGGASARGTGGVSFGEARRTYSEHLSRSRILPTGLLKANATGAFKASRMGIGQNDASRYHAGLAGAAATKALRERGHKMVVTKHGQVQYHGPTSGKNLEPRAKAAKVTVAHDGGGKAAKRAPAVSGRQVGVRMQHDKIGHGLLAQSGFKLGEARKFYAGQVHAHRQLGPSTLGGALTSTRLAAKSHKLETGQRAVAAVSNRAVARVISENRRAKAVGSRHTGSGTQPSAAVTNKSGAIVRKGRGASASREYVVSSGGQVRSVVRTGAKPTISSFGGKATQATRSSTASILAKSRAAGYTVKAIGSRRAGTGTQSSAIVPHRSGAVVSRPGPSGRAAGGVRLGAKAGNGPIAQAKIPLGRAREQYVRQVTRLRQADPRSGYLGGQLTATRMNFEGKSRQAIRERSLGYAAKTYTATEAIVNRAVARVISENKSKRLKAK